VSKQRTVATIPATSGRPFRIDRKANLYLLKRPLSNGRHQTIVMTRDDAIRVCNSLIDAIEEQDNQA
jgi:hypothetical protein